MSLFLWSQIRSWLEAALPKVNSFFNQNQENFFVSALLQTYHAMMYYNVCWVRTATRGAPCNKSAMTIVLLKFPTWLIMRYYETYDYVSLWIAAY